jgi:UPF0716 protein FxsA
MFFRLLILFTVIPIVELYLLVKIGQHIGTLNTIAVVILTGIAGASFAKSQGAQVINQIRQALSQGQLPSRELLEGAMVLVGAVMLITPGFLTDLFGLTLLFPLTRTFYANMAGKYFKNKFQSGQWRYTAYTNMDTNTSLEEESLDESEDNIIDIEDDDDPFS